jgi:hypothetical protein
MIYQNFLSVRLSHSWLVTGEHIHESPIFIYHSVLILEILRFSQRYCFRFKFSWVFGRGCTNFPKNQEPPQNFRLQKGDTKQVSYWRRTNIRQRTQFNRTCVLLHVDWLCYRRFEYTTFLTVSTGILRLPWLRVFRAFSSVVRQMLGYTSQRRGTVRTLPN